MRRYEKSGFALLLILAMVFLSACAGSPPAEQTASGSEWELSGFTGSWEGTLGEPLNYRFILDCAPPENGPRTVTISLVADTWNYYYMDVNQSFEDDTLKLWWNNEANRAEISFRFNEADELEGVFSQYGQTASAIFTKVADVGVKGDAQVKLQENLTELLMENSNFDRADGVPVSFGYDMDDPGLTELREKYKLDETAGEGDTQSKAVNLLLWLGNHTQHKGDYDNHVAKNSLALLEYTYDKGGEAGVNCYNLSVILTEACLSVGIQARNLWLMPGNPNDSDNHVVTIVYLPEKQKWIMLDPSFRCYLTDAKGNILSPMEIREKLAAREEMRLNPESKQEYMNYANYLAKDLYYFQSIQTTGFGVFEEWTDENPMINLCPEGLDLNQWNAASLRYRYEYGNSGMTEDSFKQREEEYLQQKNIFTVPASFWSK